MAYSKSKTTYKSKYQIQQETAANVDVLCSGVSFDFSSHPRYEDIKQYVLDETKREDEEEMEMMIEDGFISSPEEYQSDYGTPQREIVERINRYMLNVTDLPTDLVLIGVDRDVAENEQYLLAAIAEKYGYPVTTMKAHELSSEKDTLMQKTYDAISDVYKTDDYQKYLDLTSFWDRYSARNVAFIMAQRPNAISLKGYGGISKDGEPYGWWAEGRGVASGAQSIKIWQPNMKHLKTETDVDKYLKSHPDYGKAGDTYDQKKQSLMQEIAQKGFKDVIDGFRLGAVFDIMDTVPRDGKEDNLQELLNKIYLKKPLTEDMQNFPTIVECVEKAMGLQPQTLALNPNVAQQEALYLAIQDYAEKTLRTQPDSIAGIKNREPLTGDMHKMETMMSAYLVTKHLGIKCDDKIAFEMSGIMKNEMSDQMLHVGKRAMFTTAHERAANFSKQFSREFDKAFEPYKILADKQQTEQAVEEPKAPALFTCSPSVAADNNQKQEWFESKRLNEECKNDIAKAISDNSKPARFGQTVDYKMAIDTVMSKYDTERISLVLAHDVIHTEQQLANNTMIDGRYHHNVQDWAKNVLQSYSDLSFKIFPDSIISDKSHPVIVDAFIDEFMSVVEEKQKAAEKAQKARTTEKQVERD
jgi:hypothetical protein